MKKIFWFSLFVLLFLTTPVFAANNIYLDGNKINLNAPPVTENNRMLVPLRSISEALGCEVQYDKDTQTIRTSRNGTYLRLTLGSKNTYVNDKLTTLDVPAKTINGSTLVPLRFVSETLGLDVKYDNVDVHLITRDYAKVHFIDVGDGDAIYIQLPNKQDILIDAGNEKTVNSVLQCLRENNVDDIDLLIATHPHENQMGGIPMILDKYKVEHIIESGKADGTDTYRKFREAIQKEGAKIEVANKQKYTLNGASFQILSSSQETLKRDVNGSSVVSLLTVGKVKYLFMADVEWPYDAKQELPGEVQIIKAAAEGGLNSTSQAFLDKAKPETVILSVSKENIFNYPVEDTLQRIKNSGAGIARTSHNGDIVVTTNGIDYSVSISRDEVPEVKRRVEPPASHGLYVGDAHGDTFHWPGCGRTDDIKLDNKVWFKNALHAKDNGYQPCHFCRPE